MIKGATNIGPTQQGCGEVCNSRETHTWALLNSKMERYEDKGRHKLRSYSTVMWGGVGIKEDTNLGPMKQ